MFLTTWLLLVVIAILTVLYVWVKYTYSYWKRRNIPFVEPFPLLGNLKEMLLMSTSPAEGFTELYNHPNTAGHPVFGAYMFNKPALIIKEPALAKTIFIKEFSTFTNRYANADPHGDALSKNNLFFAKSADWKNMRVKITPVFTSGKLKQMFPLIEKIGTEFDECLCRLTEDQKSLIQEVKEINGRYSTDVIASVAYGLQANSLKDPNSEFRRNGRAIFVWNSYTALSWLIMFFLPQMVSLLRVKIFNKEAASFLRNSINFAMTNRVKSGVLRNDLIDILVNLKKNDELQGEIVDTDKYVAQAAIFFTAGFETSSSVISFGLHELSRKPDLQKRLRDEIKESLANNDGKITYESLHEMEYLNMVVQEILRLYPPQPFIDRECALPENEKEFSLKPHLDFSIPHRMPVYYPVYAIQRDPKYFPNPNEFDPERFSPENQENIVPFSYIPFGIGPRMCIGERMGTLQSKVGLVNFLRNHYVEPCEKSHQEMQLDPRGLLLSAKGGIYLKIIRDTL